MEILSTKVRGKLSSKKDEVADAKRRVLQYPGVVAWYCALKLELYASYVLAYDDIFAVYEWGAGGIVHMHLLGWLFPGRGRYDIGAWPSYQRRTATPPRGRRMCPWWCVGPKRM